MATKKDKKVASKEVVDEFAPASLAEAEAVVDEAFEEATVDDIIAEEAVAGEEVEAEETEDVEIDFNEYPTPKPCDWHLTFIDGEFVAVNSVTNKRFEGTRAQFNEYLRS